MNDDFLSLVTCGRCDGTGRTHAGISEGICPDCHGKGYVKL